MPSTASYLSTATALPRPALVDAVGDARVRVRLARSGRSASEEARLAVMGYRPSPGDRVLVQGSDEGHLYVVGVLHTAGSPALCTPSGASATVEQERLSLRAADGSLLAVYDAATGELTLSAPEHLKLRVPRGRLSLEAAALEASFAEACWTVGSWQLDASRVVQRCRDALLRFEGVVETRARRVRTLVDRTLELSARRTSVTSEQDTRIDGKRVLLG